MTTDNPNVDLFDQLRGEGDVYKAASLADTLPVPMTREGFEGMLQAICDKYRPENPLPQPNDALRTVLAGYIHHIGNSIATLTLEACGIVLHKSISNSATWRIDQEIKAQARAIQAEFKAKAQAEADAAKPLTRRVRRAKARLAAVPVPSGQAS